MIQLDPVVFGNPIRTWGIAGAIFLGVVVLLTGAQRLLVRRLGALATRTVTHIDDLAVELVKRVRLYFVVMVALSVATQALTMHDRAREALRWVTVIAFILQAGAWGNGLISHWSREWAGRRGEDAQSASTLAAFGGLVRFLMWLMLALVAAQNLGLNVSTLVTGLGITGVAVALAVQNILGDLFAALSIVLDKPFFVGDVISVDTIVGTVEKIGLKTTRVRSLSGEQIIFSNTDLLRSRVRNLKRMYERRCLFTIGVTYDTPLDKVESIPALIREIIESTPRTRFDRAHILRLAESALDIEVVYWVTSADYLVFADTQQAINLAILRRFSAHDIAFAFPTRRVVVHDVNAATAAAASAAAMSAATGATDDPEPRRS